MDPIRFFFRRVPSGDKIFSRFHYVFPLVNWKCQTPFCNHNKTEEYQMDPIWFCFRRVPSEDKTISKFQKADFMLEFWKYQHAFPKNTVEWRECQMDPIWSTFAESLQGIKYLTLKNTKRCVSYKRKTCVRPMGVILLNSPPPNLKHPQNC